MDKGKKAKRILMWISWGIFFALSALIIVEAATPADASSAQSGFLAGVVSSFLDLFPDVPKEVYAGLEGFLRKAIGHFGLFLLTGSWGVLAFLLTMEDNKQQYFYSLLFSGAIGLALALGSEAIQLIPSLHRSGEFLDSLIDLSGYLFGVLLCSLIFYLVVKKGPEEESAG